MIPSMADSDPPRRPTWLVFYVFPILSGLLLGASHVPLPTGFLAYVGLIPLLLSAGVVLVIGVFNQDVVNLVQDFLEPFNLPKGTGR